MSRPKASEQYWHRIFHQANIKVYEAHDYRDFYYRVDVENKRSKYFWGETAWADYQRYAYDEMLTAAPW